MAVEAHRKMVYYLFDVLHQHFDEQPPPSPDSMVYEIPIHAECCLFVTWNKDGRLAGCLGRTSGPRPLHTLLPSFAVASATRDSRFRPLQRKDMHRLDCVLSLLHSFEPAAHVYDWVPGVHGITIEFSGHRSKRRYCATYLPQVARDQRWDVQTTVENLVRKSGYKGKIDDSLIKRISCERYQASLAHAHHTDWMKWKDRMKHV